MHTIKLDLNHGSAFVDSVPIEVDKNGFLVASISKLCSPFILTPKGKRRYHLQKKVSACGQPAEGIIEISEGRILSLTLLFDLIEFFSFTILESKVITAFEKRLNLKFVSNHPNTAFLSCCDWGSAIFLYDIKQGDLSLEIKFEHRSTEPNLKE